MRKYLSVLVLMVMLSADGKLVKGSECQIAENDQPDKYDSVFVCNQLYEEPFRFDNGVSGVITHIGKIITRVKVKS